MWTVKDAGKVATDVLRQELPGVRLLTLRLAGCVCWLLRLLAGLAGHYRCADHTVSEW
jgi:hypothetical protein